MVIIKWRNKWSGEEGFVKCLNRKEGYFENTYSRDEAKTWKKSAVKSIINTLCGYCSDNDYEAVSA